MFKKKNIGLFLYPLLIGFLTGGSEARAAESLENAMADAAAAMAERLSASGLKKLAVAEFTDIGGYRSALGPFLADELTRQLIAAKPHSFEIVDRQQLMNEMIARNLNIGGLDAAGTAEVGKALGLQTIVTGTISDLGQEINVTIRAVSVATGLIDGVAVARFPRQGAAENLLRQSAGAAGPSRFPAHRSQAADVFFKNDLLQLTVESISVGPKNESIHLVLALENLTDQDLELKMDSRNTSLTAGDGGKFWCRSTQGIEMYRYNDPTSFAAKHRSVISLSFKADGETALPGNYSFSAIFWRSGKERSKSFSVGITGIRLEPGAGQGRREAWADF